MLTTESLLEANDKILHRVQAIVPKNEKERLEKESCIKQAEKFKDYCKKEEQKAFDYYNKIWARLEKKIKEKFPNMPEQEVRAGILWIFNKVLEENKIKNQGTLSEQISLKAP